MTPPLRQPAVMIKQRIVHPYMTIRRMAIILLGIGLLFQLFSYHCYEFLGFHFNDHDNSRISRSGTVGQDKVENYEMINKYKSSFEQRLVAVDYDNDTTKAKQNKVSEVRSTISTSTTNKDSTNTVSNNQHYSINNSTTSDLGISKSIQNHNQAHFETIQTSRNPFQQSEKEKSQLVQNCTDHHLVLHQIIVQGRGSGGRQFNSSSIAATFATKTSTEPSQVLRQPRILCFVMTHSGYHRTRVQAIVDTWGKRCDKLLVASNTSDPSLSALRMESDASYLGLWLKLNETLQYVWDNYYVPPSTSQSNQQQQQQQQQKQEQQQQQQYDWIFKADDDTYAIMDNLRDYLASPDIQQKQNKKEPLIFGRRYSSPRYRNLEQRPVYFNNPQNEGFRHRFYQKMNRHKPVFYNYGGAGYVMNWPYVERFLQIQKTEDTIRHATPPEDQCHGVVMAYHDIWPQPTRDALGRERFHQEPPYFMYSMGAQNAKIWQDNHKATGGISTGPECCSSQSITFHHMSPHHIRVLDEFLYRCRGLE